MMYLIQYYRENQARQLQPQGETGFYKDTLRKDTIIADRQFWNHHTVIQKAAGSLYSWVAAD